MSENSWIDDDWSHDWLFWLGAVVAAVGTALSVALTDTPTWGLIVGALGLFAFTVAVAGFVRTAHRSYRSE